MQGGGFFAKVLSAVFFPATDPSVQILNSLMVFAIRFIARPFGGIFFGYLGDRIGRAKVLTITPILIFIPTVAISILPPYETWGIISTLLLVILRIFQGFLMSGERRFKSEVQIL